jgi:histidinol-phosphate aminotransferase
MTSTMSGTRTEFVEREVLRSLAQYDFEREPCEIELANNTNVYGPPPTALKVARDASGDMLAEYPTLYSATVREAIASYVGVDPSCVIVGAGSDDIIDCGFRALADPGSTVAYMHPTFMMARYFATTNSLRTVPVPLTAQFDCDADALLAIDAAVTYVCTPNNPTGTELSTESLERVLESARGVVMLDEAYAEFASVSHGAGAPAHGRLLVTGTLSKAFGLAGIRVGYGIAARPLIAALEKVRGPYRIPTLSERAAVAALTNDVEWMRSIVATISETRERFATRLRELGLRPLPSAANFVFVPIANAHAVSEAMYTRGVAVRSFVGLPHVGEALRITIGRPEVMDRVAMVLAEVLS